MSESTVEFLFLYLILGLLTNCLAHARGFFDYDTSISVFGKDSFGIVVLWPIFAIFAIMYGVVWIVSNFVGSVREAIKTFRSFL